MKILITGATGLVGKEITELLLQNGLKINYLTTSKSKIQHQPNFKGFYWDPQQGIIDENCLLGVAAIIHLAGASISERWTAQYKEEIIESRVLSANLLYTTLKNNYHQVEHFISASAVGIYPDSLSASYNEDFKNYNDSFLSNVVVKWEESVSQIQRLDIKVAKIRIGLVLSLKGGALVEILKPIKLGLGSPFGSGKQIQSWIHIHDVANLFLFVLQNGIDGVYNATAPFPVTNKELTTTLATLLEKPFFMPNIPKFIMKIILGEMHTLLFESQNVNSSKIVSKGFNFEFKTLSEALQNLLSQK